MSGLQVTRQTSLTTIRESPPCSPTSPSASPRKSALQSVVQWFSAGRQDSPRNEPTWEVVSWTSAQEEPQEVEGRKTRRRMCHNCGAHVTSSSCTPRPPGSPVLTHSASFDSTYTMATGSSVESLSEMQDSEDDCFGGTPGCNTTLICVTPPHNGSKVNEQRHCSCGEFGCSCRCSEELTGPDSPGPRDLRFFPAQVDYRKLAGINDDPAVEPMFCSPECRWSSRARMEFVLNKKYGK